MTSGKQIHCWIVTLPDPAARHERAIDRAERIADPFIFGLISKLQAEVREERERKRGVDGFITSHNRFTTLLRSEPAEQAEAEITWHDWPLDFTEPDFDAWERGSVPPGGRWSLPR